MFTNMSNYLLEACASNGSAQVMTQGLLYWSTLPKVGPVALCRTPFVIIDLETLGLDCLTLFIYFLFFFFSLFMLLDILMGKRGG